MFPTRQVERSLIGRRAGRIERDCDNSHAYPTEALLESRLPLPESAAQEQWYSPKYSSTWSRVISTEANVYRTPVSGSTCSDVEDGVTTSELQLKMRVHD